MKMNRRKTGIILLIVFTLLIMISGGMFLRQYMDSKKSSENFEQLEELVDEIPEETEESKEDEVEEELSEEELEALERAQAMEKYGELFQKNNDFMGWISIEGTNVNYPVMQTPHHPDYYLKKNFEKEYSDYGVPYIEETCAMGISNNIVIYGHHMNDGTMFADLVKYYDKDYRDEHPMTQFDTISGFGTYEVVAAFKFDTNNETFKYNEFVTMDAAYVQKVNQAAGFTVISYHQFDTDDEDVNGEESIKDASESIEDTIINKMETKRLVELVSQLSKEDQELIYCFYLTETPMNETVYAKRRGIPTSTLNDRKVRAITRLKKLYFS